jgi:hypothetical protein
MHQTVQTESNHAFATLHGHHRTTGCSRLKVSPELHHILRLQLGIRCPKLHWEAWVVLRGCTKLGKANRITPLPICMAIAEQQVARA